MITQTKPVHILTKKGEFRINAGELENIKHSSNVLMVGWHCCYASNGPPDRACLQVHIYSLANKKKKSNQLNVIPRTCEMRFAYIVTSRNWVLLRLPRYGKKAFPRTMYMSTRQNTTVCNTEIPEFKVKMWVMTLQIISWTNTEISGQKWSPYLPYICTLVAERIKQCR